MKDILRDFWRLAKPFWVSKEKWKAYGLLAVVVGLTLLSVFMSVKLNFVINDIYTALQKYDMRGFLISILWFLGFALVYIVAGVSANFYQQALQIRWRRWLNDDFLKRWFGQKSYYLWTLTGKRTDNPDQRIAEDISKFVESALNISIGLLNKVVTLFSFLGILWELSGPLHLGPVTIPAYMVWVALIYSAAGTWLVFKVGRPLIGLNVNQQRYEADYRFGLVRLRENSESVALSDGEPAETRVLNSRFGNIVENFVAIMKRVRIIGFASSFYGQLANVFPMVIACPPYFAKHITLGGLMQITRAFGEVQGALSFFIDAYQDLAGWRATIKRLTTFSKAITDAENLPVSAKDVVKTDSEVAAFQVQNLQLSEPDATPLMQPLNFSINAGERVLISGPSGCGKSTLVRTVAGIWPYATGSIRMPSSSRPFVVPQKPYLPIGTFREAICYPDASTAFDNDTVLKVMSACGLEGFVGHLDQPANWALALSGGEQQRVAFARILLHRPDWIFLDEATSALDEPSEAKLYQTLGEELPNATVVSIGHRASLEKLHSRILSVA